MLASSTTRDTDTVTLDITKSQVAILAKRGTTLVDQGRNSYLMNALMLSGCTYLGHGMYKPTVNRVTKAPYFLH